MGCIDNEKLVKEILKETLDHNSEIPQEVKMNLKLIIDIEHNPERLLQECLICMITFMP